MSQLVATQPTSFFDQSRDFAYQGQFTREKDTFAYAQTGYEGYDGLDQGNDSGYYSYYQYSMPMYNNMYSSVNTPFYTTFPRAKDYYTQETVLETFPHLAGLNSLDFDVNALPEHAQFFILRSSNDDNIHKAIKYHMWSTTTGGKAALSNAWKDAEKKGLTPEIYLIFSVVNSNHILGVAKLTSDLKVEESFKFWWEPMKWFGSFQIQWVFIKDIHYSKFEHIQDFGGNNFGNLKDSSKLSLENGKEVLAIFRDFAAKSSIFGSFAYMDRREDYIRLQRENSYFNKYFDECCAAYQTNPEAYSPAKKTSYNRRGKYHGNNNNYNNYGNKRQGNGYYRKTYYNVKQQGNFATQNTGSNMNTASQEFLSISEYPPLSLAEQYGIKSETKRKPLKLAKKNSGEKTEKKEETETGKEEVQASN
jgi:hypothetical protein